MNEDLADAYEKDLETLFDYEAFDNLSQRSTFSCTQAAFKYAKTMRSLKAKGAHLASGNFGWLRLEKLLKACRFPIVWAAIDMTTSHLFHGHLCIL